ncbi:hypothetical protein HPB51_013427 [Rhipicephalus microplus]|uniref:Uncharacterized protein n=1 Tax=Rhipicephalus microplus TaxID=6941 RepID=A0A9J6D4W8_RHIMP|nr:hypothetical protein HPB51_013427 [Rhipicephalus microplus]
MMQRTLAPACGRGSVEPLLLDIFNLPCRQLEPPQHPIQPSPDHSTQKIFGERAFPDPCDRDANRNDELALLAPPDAALAAATTAASRRDASATQLHPARPRRVLPSEIAAVLAIEVVAVEGTGITSEDATLEAGLISSHRNKQRKHASNAPASPIGQGSASDTPMLNKSPRRLPRKPRQPRLPDDHVKVVIHPKAGLNLSKVGEAQLRDAILREVDLHATLLKEDIYHTRVEANLIIVSTPNISNAEMYSRISNLQVETETYDVRAYATSPKTQQRK